MLCTRCTHTHTHTRTHTHTHFHHHCCFIFSFTFLSPLFFHFILFLFIFGGCVFVLFFAVNYYKNLKKHVFNRDLRSETSFSRWMWKLWYLVCRYSLSHFTAPLFSFASWGLKTKTCRCLCRGSEWPFCCKNHFLQSSFHFLLSGTTRHSNDWCLIMGQNWFMIHQ